MKLTDSDELLLKDKPRQQNKSINLLFYVWRHRTRSDAGDVVRSPAAKAETDLVEFR